MEPSLLQPESAMTATVETAVLTESRGQQAGLLLGEGPVELLRVRLLTAEWLVPEAGDSVLLRQQIPRALMLSDSHINRTQS